MRVDDNEPLVRPLPEAFHQRWPQAAFDRLADDAQRMPLR